MNKSLKKILVAGASLLMFASVGAGTNNLVKPVHAHSLMYRFWHTPTGKLYHGITLGGRYYPAGTKLYNANYATGSYGASMGPSPYAPRYIIPAWARKRDHAHHYHHHRKILYQYQIRPHYGAKTYNRLFKRLVREMEAHGAHYDSSNETSKLSHRGRYIELTGTNTGVVTNGLKALWPDQALNLLHRMYRYTPRHYYRPVRKHYRRHVTKRRRRTVRKARARHYYKRTDGQMSRRYQPEGFAQKAVPRNQTKSFVGSAAYKAEWNSALQINRKAARHDLKVLNAAKKNGNKNQIKKALRKYNYMNGFVKHDQRMLNLRLR